MKRPTIQDTRSVLAALRDELKTHPENIETRVLRATKDLALNDVDEILKAHVPGYNEIKPLGEEFGKGIPA